MRAIKTGTAKSLICAAAAALDFTLFLVKLYVAVSSNSISIYVDSLNSLADTLVCIIALVGFRVALMPPNGRYPFGYGRSEDVVNFLLSLVILITGLAFVYSSLQRLLYPVPVWYSHKYAVLIAATAAVKLIMAFCFKAAHRKFGSAVLKSMKTDSILDFFISACIVVSFTLTQKLGYSIDSMMGLAASAVIVISGAKTLHGSLGTLVGKADSGDLADAEKALRDAGLSQYVERIYCHRYGEKKIYNVKISSSLAQCEDDTVNKLHRLFSEQLDAEVYIKGD